MHKVLDGCCCWLCTPTVQAFICCPSQLVCMSVLAQPCLHVQTGEICLDILKTAWSPAWTLHSVCQAVMALMSDPAPDSPLNCDAGVFYCLYRAQPQLAECTRIYTPSGGAAYYVLSPCSELLHGNTTAAAATTLP